MRYTRERWEKNFLASVKYRSTGCWEWSKFRDPLGYGRCRLNGRKYTTHRASWLHFRGTVPKGLCVLHKCDNPPCVNPDHLFVGTFKDNTIDKELKGRANHPRGVEHHASVLTPAKVKWIRKNRYRLTMHATAKKLGTSVSCVNHVLQGRSWRHVK